jgi:hypothetical protein
VQKLVVSLARLAAFATSVALVWALVVAWLGNVRLQIGPVVISSGHWLRPALTALAFYAVSLVLARAEPRSGPDDSASRRSLGEGASWAWWLDRLDRYSAVLALAAAAGVLWIGLAYGTRAVGGSDTLGYVSEAYLWLKGDLKLEQPLSRQAPWPFAGDTLAPLGYKSGATRHTMVPICAPGLPLIMAASVKLCGGCGPFYVAPVFGALLVVLTWMLAYRLTGSALTSASAAILMASSPAFLVNLIVPMSDVVTAALWVGALIFLTGPRLWRAAAAGAMASVAILVRPNLVPLCFACALAAEMWPVPTVARPRRGARALAFLLGAAPGAAAVGAINNYLYGSPLASGYPPLSELYAIDRLPGNLWRYATWLASSHAAVVALALVSLLIRQARPAWLTRDRLLPAAAFVGTLCVVYFFYLEFTAWWYLRFFLPAFPFLFMLSGAALAWLARLPSPAIGVPALIAALVILVETSVGFALARGLRDTGVGEQRYVAIAEYIDRQLPATAAIIAMQHTGTIAFYTGRTVIRYDYLPRDRLRYIVEWLAANGHPPYVVLEDWEEASFRHHFSRGQDAMGRLDVALLAETAQSGKVRIYDPRRAADPSVPPPQLTVMRTRDCAGPGAGWR